MVDDYIDLYQELIGGASPWELRRSAPQVSGIARCSAVSRSWLGVQICNRDECVHYIADEVDRIHTFQEPRSLQELEPRKVDNLPLSMVRLQRDQLSRRHLSAGSPTWAFSTMILAS